jgi:hypothetical protein
LGTARLAEELVVDRGEVDKLVYQREQPQESQKTRNSVNWLIGSISQLAKSTDQTI